MTRTLAALLMALGFAAANPGYAATTFLDAVLAEADGAVVTASDAAIGKALGRFGLEATPASIHTANVQRLIREDVGA